MEPNTNNLEQRLIAMEAKLDAMNKILKRLYMIFIITGIATALGLIIPLIGLAFVIPKFMSSYTQGLGL